MWIVHQILRAGYAGVHKTGFLSTELGQRTYEKAYERYKLLLEQSAIQDMAARIKPDSLAIDVGANIGVHTRVFAEHVGSLGQVLAIEPDPANIRSLRRKFSSPDSRVRIVEAVASDKIGDYHLERDPLNPAGHAIGEQGLPVKGVTIDLLVRESKLPVSFIKIDVEGAEEMVLKGARETLSTFHPTLCIEFSPDRLSKFGTNPTELLDKLEGDGYEFFIPGKGAKPQTAADLMKKSEARGYIDVLMVWRAAH